MAHLGNRALRPPRTVLRVGRTEPSAWAIHCKAWNADSGPRVCDLESALRDERSFGNAVSRWRLTASGSEKASEASTNHAARVAGPGRIFFSCDVFSCDVAGHFSLFFILCVSAEPESRASRRLRTRKLGLNRLLRRPRGLAYLSAPIDTEIAERRELRGWRSGQNCLVPSRNNCR